MQEENSESTLSKVDQFCNQLPAGSLIFMAGDMNARTGAQNATTGSEHLVLQELLDHESFRNSSPLAPGTRNSKDTVINDRGAQLIDFGCEWNLTILNGSVLGDILGDWTCYRYNGNSVVDYIMISHKLKDTISHQEVQEFSEHSDHRPLLCSLRTCPEKEFRTVTEHFEDRPLGFKWNHQQNESKKKFCSAQKQESVSSKIAEMCSVSCNNKEEVYELNNKLVEIFKEIANSSLECKRRPKGTKRANKKVWFDGECRDLKRFLTKVAKRYSRNPENETVRNDFYQTKKYYRSVLKLKKNCYYANLNRNIEESNQIKWSNLKKLKDAKKDPDQLDLHDLTNFYEFFKRLYSDTPTDVQLPSEPEIVTNNSMRRELADELLNEDITIDELNSAIMKLKLGKAVGEDCVPNEFLRCSNMGMKLSILHLFNQCLSNGVYPWNVSLVTPLHKKGDRANPDNYRAIAVSSAIGKLFSNILLERLVKFRNVQCPDPPNQLGFCKEAQTADHIFTLSTCIEKYLGAKKRIYSCFIDFKKAFDSVSREALLYKLANLGIEGRFLDCIKHMYSNSKAKIKLLGKLSNALDVLVGTEQGHPMSPELFKIFLLGLSDELNSTTDTHVPELNNVSISHLLWADDLVLLALDGQSLQKLINVVHNFCTKWGLSVNISKTAILIFNSSGRLLKESTGFTYGSLNIPSDNKYCYLGITLTLSGSLSVTMEELRKKGLRAYFSLKSLVDISQLSIPAIFKLFDALIVPVLSYGCQIWFHKTAFTNQFIRKTFESKPSEYISKLASDPIERLHMKFLKWTLGVHKKTSNLFCWGDTGRCPLLQSISKQSVDYFYRLEGMTVANSENLVRHAFEDQRRLALPWFKRMSELINQCVSMNNVCQQTGDTYATRSGAIVKLQLEKAFKLTWAKAVNESSKLKFYSQVKELPGLEAYLSIPNRDVRTSVARLRSSSHRLNVETARYAQTSQRLPNKKRSVDNSAWLKSCKTCCDENVLGLQQLPFAADPIIEDERHILVTCPAYHHLRLDASDYILSSLMAWDERLPTLFDARFINEFANLVHKIFNIRFPKKKMNTIRKSADTNTP